MVRPVWFSNDLADPEIGPGGGAYGDYSFDGNGGQPDTARSGYSQASR